MNNVTIGDMLLRGWPVLSILLIMSILSIAIIVDRVRVIQAARLNARAFVAKLIGILREQGPERALEFCRRYNQPVSAVSAEILMQAGSRAARERALQHAMQAEIKRLEESTPVLATVASTAPFVGLFGTVVGIIKAFASIASSNGGGPEVVSAGIAEALITTACGLLVAIPALIAYNWCVHQVQTLATEAELAVYDLVEMLCPEKNERL